MRKLNLFTIVTLGITSVLFGTVATLSPVHAETKTGGTGQALEISPPVVNIKANPGQVVKTQINLRNISNGKLIVSNQIDDFVAGDEMGTPKLLIDSNETNPLSIKNWINPLAELTLTTKQLKSLPVTIKVPANAAPGGYYGVIRFTGRAPELTGTGVSLSASLGALIMLRVNGAVTEKMSIAEFGVSQNGKTGTIFESTPITFFERLKNEGNIHEQPSGKITITDMFGKKVANVFVNNDPKNVLPNSIRKFEQALDKKTIGDKILFGKYTADLKVTYGADNKTIDQSTTFWIIPYRLIGLAVVIIVGVITCLVVIMKRYNKFIINRAQKNPKTPKVKKPKKAKRNK